jgi:O-antigen/teichoic acid export membrane protein
VKGRLTSRAGAAVSWQAVQHFGVQAIFLIRLLVLARLLSPTDFGLQAVALVSVGLLLRVTEFGMVPALVQRPDVEERHFDAAWTVGLVRALGVGALVVIGAPLLALAFDDPRATPVIRALGVLPLLRAAASIKVTELTRKLELRSIATLRLLEAVATTVVSVALAFRFGVWALVAGSLAGPALFAVLSYGIAPHRPRLRVDTESLAPLLRFGRWVFVRSLVALAGQGVLQLVISRQLGVAELGLYVLASRLAFLPSGAASDVIGSVAFPMYSRLQSTPERAAGVFRAQALGIAALLFPVYALMLALAPSVTEELLGPRWIGTAPVIRILAIASLLGLLGDVVDPILNAFGRPAQVTLMEAIQSLTLIAAVWVLAGQYGLPGAAAAWIPAILGSQILSVLFLRRVFRRPFRGVLFPVLVVTAISVAGGVAAVLLDGWIPGFLGLLAAGAAGTLLVAGMLWAAERFLSLGLGVAAARLFPRVWSYLGLPAPESSLENGR